MNIEIGKDKDALLAQHPHFYQIHDKHARDDGYELPLSEIVDYVAAHKGDKIAYEAVARITASHGLHLMFAQIEAGETDIHKCILVGKSKSGETNSAIQDGWVKVEPRHFSALLTNTKGHSHPTNKDEITSIILHQTAIAARIGIKPNFDRLKQDFCVGCGK
jgi:hypothetical protein